MKSKLLFGISELFKLLGKGLYNKDKTKQNVHSQNINIKR